ncbi:MAG TPA: hypothetical protein VEV18_08040, partial [Steroidobacteraceae bacterium]|nr:hypothetical protein [Steroidobacteraceae bacterium]
MTDSSQDAQQPWSWRCLHCRGPLAADERGLSCTACGKHYPRIAAIPLLVREPAAYLRSELAQLTRTSHEAHRRKDSLEKIGRDAGLPDQSLDRHRDVLNTEIAQAETLLALLEGAAEALADDTGAGSSARPPSGWTTESLIPYLIRDWTSTTELEAVSARIGAALEQSFPDPSGKSVVFAACGAGGLLAEMATGFERVVGFDLTLPILRAARHLLDGKSLDIALPRASHPAGRITLRKRDARPVG